MSIWGICRTLWPIFRELQLNKGGHVKKFQTSKNWCKGPYQIIKRFSRSREGTRGGQGESYALCSLELCYVYLSYTHTFQPPLYVLTMNQFWKYAIKRTDICCKSLATKNRQTNIIMENDPQLTNPFLFW